MAAFYVPIMLLLYTHHLRDSWCIVPVTASFYHFKINLQLNTLYNFVVKV